MNRVVFIIPYYGKLPCYFPAWLTSAKAQKNIDFLLVSDLVDEKMISDAHNISLLNWSFEKTKAYFQSRFDFRICLERPYKFCDYKPAYGYIFSEYLRDYDFWGHCDIDAIFGDLYKFLEEPMKQYDAIGRWGHLSLFKNVPEINQLFMSDKGTFQYKEVFSNNYSYAFDETSGMKMIISKTPSIKYYFSLKQMVDANKLNKMMLGTKGFKNYRNQIFFFEKGKLYQCYLQGENLKYIEVMYLHFQWKTPRVISDLQDNFYIFYDLFIPRTGKKQDRQMFDRMKKYQSPIYQTGEKIVNYYLKRSIALLKMDKKQRVINHLKRNIKI